MLVADQLVTQRNVFFLKRPVHVLTGGQGLDPVNLQLAQGFVERFNFGKMPRNRRGAVDALDSDTQNVVHTSTGEPLGNGGGTTIYRLREGIERFMITDINNAAASAETVAARSSCAGRSRASSG